MTSLRRLLLAAVFLTGTAALVLTAPAARSSNLPQMAGLAARVMPAVVSIASTDPVPPAAGNSGDDITLAAGTVLPPPKAVEALGSGFVIAPSGYILTNAHVIAGAASISVTFQDGTIVPATVTGRDTDADIAVLKVNTGHPLPFVKFGNSTALRVGDWVLAIGNPYGLPGSTSAGIVSALDRNINEGTYDDFIQTDAAINRGNSGGPLFNEKGEVIGVDSAIYSPSGGSIGIGFAIPSAMAQPVAQSLMASGSMVRGWLGAATQEVTPAIQATLHLPNTAGALVGSVSPNGPANGILQPGDVITALKGVAITSPRALFIRTAQIPAGSKALITFWRNGSAHSATLCITVLPPPLDETIAPATAPAAIAIPSLGLTLSAQPAGGGATITAVTAKGPASAAGILAGNVIEQVNGQPTASAAALQAQLRQLTQAKLPAATLLITGDTANGTDPGPRWVSVVFTK
ncbi:trypsin-like peptidase domain-containing protein [Acidocella sp.]|uniref:trypsin-like peptidase domain-containing protein n=1 Tax=Acidocella sp. TaxID=50710 RepID=UPI002605981C|nr:trypsin-like peptidase domain-containing protein [Acidocella sp.]MDD2795080.1 trypsin-like peptidase domain-containing protein [Acidocella sp.]